MTDVERRQASGASGLGERRTRALPLVGVAGTRGKSTTVWLLDAMLTTAGRSTGLWSSTGVYVRGVRQPGELGPWSRVLAAVGSGELDVALQELETPLVTSVGLPEGIYPLAGITTLCGNNEDCLLSPEFSSGALAQAIVARAVRPDGLLVLNADDMAVLEAASQTKATTVLFALHPDNPALRRHLEQGGCGVWVADGSVVVGDALDQRAVVRVDEARFTLDGALIFQVQNLLCSVALAVALDVPDAAIREAVRAFSPDPVRLPGSCNIFHKRGATIVLDTARQVWTLKSLIRGIRHQPHRRTIIVAGFFSHLPEDQIVDAGRLLGRLGGVVILHQETERPIVELLKTGIAQNEIPPLVLAMPTEQQAFAHAFRMLSEGDLCLLITDDVQNAVDAVTSLDK
ncbi:hypothetical protein [Sphaerobacter sp.]|uniref:hypothetical protein n=1 Tax=Sphaerobacter sp. TaxID=2099654 RepID=UPI001D9F4C22|nr:hypothetical protein [Sphaerobacter sp.]MBX5444494.1 hypothetical protein [Sphaerobacter sp.]